MTRALAAIAGLGALVTLLVAGQVAGGIQAIAVERLTVSNTNPAPVHSTTVLNASHRYRLVASGTVSDWCDGTSTPCTSPLVLNEGVDALYCYATWRCKTPELWRQLQVNGMGLDELAGKAGKIAYSPSHTYTVEITKVSGRLTAVASDATWSAGGNSGQFTLSIIDLGVDTSSSIGPLHLRVLAEWGVPFGLSLPTQYTFVATGRQTQFVHVGAWLAPGGKLPKGQYYQTHVVYEVLRNGRWQFISTGVTNPSASPVYYCPRDHNRPGGYDWTWRATLREGPDKILATSNTVRTICVYRSGATLGSGTYDAVTVQSGTTYRARWILSVSGTRVTGTSYWSCCPGPRTDPLTGTTSGDRVVIVRRFAGQGAPPGSQTYSGRVTSAGKVTGTVSGSYIGPGSAFTLTLRK